jgi:hypothetical protein
MRTALERRNKDLQAELKTVVRLLERAKVPDGLRPYRDRLVALARNLERIAEQNLVNLWLGRDDILEDVLSDTRLVLEFVRLLGSRLSIPVLRASTSDRLCLATLAWLHGAHTQTAKFAPAFADGQCGIWPFLTIAPVYFFPSVEQRGLRFQPLLFHEFGHLLYACHKPEMDALVGELQGEVEDLLVPGSMRNDRHAHVAAARRRVVVNAWYAWAQELFCDAVGFDIGGPSFIRAFSAHLATLAPGDFTFDPTEPGEASHPVTSLRVRFLAGRAARAGFASLADSVVAEWHEISHALGIEEDFQGYFDDALEGPVLRSIDDMLTEAAPRHFADVDLSGDDWVAADSPVKLFAEAWRVWDDDPKRYPRWERRLAKMFAEA